MTLAQRIKQGLASKPVRNTTKVVNKITGASSLVDYASSKIAKHRLKGTEAQKHVEDKTTGKQALVSAGLLASSAIGIAGVGRAVARRATTSFKIPGQKKRVRIEPTWKEGGRGNTIKGMSDQKARRQDEAIIKSLPKKKRK